MIFYFMFTFTHIVHEIIESFSPDQTPSIHHSSKFIVVVCLIRLYIYGKYVHEFKEVDLRKEFLPVVVNLVKKIKEREVEEEEESDDEEKLVQSKREEDEAEF